MRTLLLVLALSLLSGCMLPEKMYHRARVASMRREAVTVQTLSKAVTISDRKFVAFSPAAYEKVVVLTSLPEVFGQSQNHATYCQAPGEALQSMETKFEQALLNKGYRAASRLNVPPVLREMSFPNGKIIAAQREKLFKGTLLLLVKLQRVEGVPVMHSYRSNIVNSTHDLLVGYRLILSLSVELVDAATSETYWAAQTRMDGLFVDLPNGVALLEDLAGRISERIPDCVSARLPPP